MGRVFWGIFLAAGSLIGCSEEQEPRPPQIGATYGPGPTLPDCERPQEADTTDVCSEETVQLFSRQPTIYFVLDVSGSMADYLMTGGDTKLEAAKTALSQVVKDIGHRSKFGMAVFPGPNGDFGCAPGEEVFRVQAGDPIECLNRESTGPVYQSFLRNLNALHANGGTPLSATLEALTPSLKGREDTTAVVLITDGSPNCNTDLLCGADSCSLNLMGATSFDSDGHDVLCDEEFNCCDPEITSNENSNSYCVDGDASVERLEDLRDAGIATYVIGVLGSEDFHDVMSRLAFAGGRPREGERAYYDVESLQELSDTVRTIGLNLTQTCTIELLERPLFANELNVYFDGELVPSGGANGWTLDEDTVTIHGEACDQMESGEVDLVQLLSGCQTIVR